MKGPADPSLPLSLPRRLSFKLSATPRPGLAATVPSSCTQMQRSASLRSTIESAGSGRTASSSMVSPPPIGTSSRGFCSAWTSYALIVASTSSTFLGMLGTRATRRLTGECGVAHYDEKTRAAHHIFRPLPPLLRSQPCSRRPTPRSTAGSGSEQLRLRWLCSRPLLG